MMIPTRPTYHHGDLRNSLIRAALALVAERGVEGFSLREAARTVGVSASACYRHFADREELLAAVAHEGLDTLAEKMRVAAAAHEGASAFDAVCRFWAYSEAYLHFALEHPAHFRVMHAVPKSEHSREIMLPRSPAVLAQPGMEALVAAGVVAPESAGRALLAMLDVGARPRLAGRHRPPAARRRAHARGRPRCRAADGAARRGRRPGAVPARAPAARAASARALAELVREPAAVAERDLGPYAPRVTLLDLTPDELLSTTRAVRKRLDFDRPVEREVLDECLALAQQAPNASNSEPWRFVVVTEQATRAKLAECYATGWAAYRKAIDERARARRPTSPVLDLGAVPRRSLPRGAGDGAAVPHPARRQRARRPARPASTARSSRPPGASSWPRAREGSARAGRRCTCGASATPPRCSASRTTACSRWR